jgi:hypothetical protein
MNPHKFVDLLPVLTVKLTLSLKRPRKTITTYAGTQQTHPGLAKCSPVALAKRAVGT